MRTFETGEILKIIIYSSTEILVIDFSTRGLRLRVTLFEITAAS